MFESSFPRDQGLKSNTMIMPSRVYYRDPKYDIIHRKPSGILPKPNTLDTRIVNPSRNYDGFVIASHSMKKINAFRVDPKNIINPIININKKPKPNIQKVNFLKLKQGIDSNVTSDVKQKPTFQIYVQIIRQIYKRMIEDVTINEQQILNDALETFQKDYIDKKNIMNPSQLDILLKNYISKVREVFTSWYDSSDKSFNPILTIESGTVLDEIQTDNDELIQILKDRDNREEILQSARAEADFEALQEAQDLLDEENRKNEEIIAERQKENKRIIKEENEKIKTEDAKIKQGMQYIQNAYDDGAQLLDDHKEKIDELTEEARLAQDAFDTFGDQKNQDIADAKNQEIVDLVAIYNTLDALVQGYETQLTQTETDRKANKNRKVTEVRDKKDKENKEIERLKQVDEKDRKAKEAKFEKEAEPILKGLAKFNAERTQRNALIQKVAPLKDSVSDDRLQEIYDNLPKEYRDPENANLNAKYREALRKTFKDKDNVVISNNERRVIYKNNYDRFLDLVKFNYRYLDLNDNIYDAIVGNKNNITSFKKEFKKIIKSEPQKVDIDSYKIYAVNRTGGVPTPTRTIKISGKKSSKSKSGSGRKKQLSKSLKDVLKKYNL